jgi:hypothetical protein
VRAWLARFFLCPASLHDWQFVVLRLYGQNWITKHCRRCHWQTAAISLDHQPGRRSC